MSSNIAQIVENRHERLVDLLRAMYGGPGGLTSVDFEYDAKQIENLMAQPEPWERGEYIVFKIQPGTFMDEWWMEFVGSKVIWHRRIEPDFRYEYCGLEEPRVRWGR